MSEVPTTGLQALSHYEVEGRNGHYAVDRYVGDACMEVIEAGMTKTNAKLLAGYLNEARWRAWDLGVEFGRGVENHDWMLECGWEEPHTMENGACIYCGATEEEIA